MADEQSEQAGHCNEGLSRDAARAVHGSGERCSHEGGIREHEGVVRLPSARVRESGARNDGMGWLGRLAWVVPVLAAMVVTGVFVQSRLQRGPEVRISFVVGNGIKAGDPVVYRGVRIGEVESVEVRSDLSGVVVRARLMRTAKDLASEGTKFWIVRPEVSLTKVSGLETLVGPRYVEAEPDFTLTTRAIGRMNEFVGLEESQGRAGGSAIGGAAGVPGPRDLVLTLQADRARSLTVGSPVQFRGVKVGQVLGMELNANGMRVDVRVVVFEPYTQFVRTNSQWWNASGFGLDFGLVGGFSLRTGSLESIITGGIAFATPDKPGPIAKGDQVFVLAPEAQKDWFEWAPNLTPVQAKGTGTVGVGERERD